MKRNRMLVWGLVLVLLMSVFPVNMAEAEADGREKAVIMYSSENKEVEENQKVLDGMISRYTTDISYVRANEVEAEDLEGATHLFYYGQVEEDLEEETVARFTEFDGIKTAIGQNADQLSSQLNHVDTSLQETMDGAYEAENEENAVEFEPQAMFPATPSESAEILLYGTNKNQENPLFFIEDDIYYYAAPDLESIHAVLLAKQMPGLFDKPEEEGHPGYLRLEDVHPLGDAEQLQEIADYLKSENIPYMIAVIPIYTDPETGREYHFSDNKELTSVLQEMQADGASLVLHGYTHQFRQSETGEGFEFWDVENNMPIYHGPDEEVVQKTEEDFDSAEEFEEYNQDNLDYERAYIENRIESGIDEMAKYDLYPLAFEAPHYTMSQNGYKVLSEYFSTYVGQIQLSDENWEIMRPIPTVGQPTYLHGMTLYPETMGYVQPEEPDSVDIMMKNAEEYQFIDRGVTSAFYHPYLGLDGLIEVVEGMKQIEGIEWIDLKETDSQVITDRVEIRADNGEIDVTKDRIALYTSGFSYPLYFLNNTVETVVRGIAVIGGLAVLIFFFYIFRNRSQANKG